jgi:ABC-type sugar transport system ATPase subunit
MGVAAGSSPVLAGQAVLEGRGLSKYYGSVTALDNVDITLYGREILALVGDNGAGKSTLVSILSGAIQPDQGAITLAGRHVRFPSPRSAASFGISTVFQDLALVDQRDVAANLFLGHEPRRFGVVVDRRQMLYRAAEALAGLKINLPSMHTEVRKLSGGQRQAVALARSMLLGGKVMLLDEPTAALGAREGRRVLELIKGLREHGYAILLVSHNFETVFELADRIMVLRLGRRLAYSHVSETSRDEVLGLIVGARGAT